MRSDDIVFWDFVSSRDGIAFVGPIHFTGAIAFVHPCDSFQLFGRSTGIFVKKLTFFGERINFVEFTEYVFMRTSSIEGTLVTSASAKGTVPKAHISIADPHKTIIDLKDSF
jgi:hypothetical protein